MGGLRVAAEQLAQAQDHGAAPGGGEVHRRAHLPHPRAEGLVAHVQREILADPVGAVVRVEEDRGFLDQLPRTGLGRRLRDRDGGLEVELVVLAPGERAQARHADGHVREGVDHDLVAAEGAGEVTGVEHVGDDRAAAAPLDDRHSGVAPRDAGDLVPGGDERLHGFLAEHTCGTGDRDPHADLLRRGSVPSPAVFPEGAESRGSDPLPAPPTVPWRPQILWQSPGAAARWPGLWARAPRGAGGTEDPSLFTGSQRGLSSWTRADLGVKFFPVRAISSVG